MVQVLSLSLRTILAASLILLPGTGEASIPDYLGDFAKAIEQHEPRSGTFTTTRTEYDGLGRPVTTTLAGTYVSRTGYDEAGNALEQQRPGMNAEQLEYDARGLMLVRKRADGALIRMRYDELGTLRAYVDEENETTEYDVDGIGRVVRVRYPRTKVGSGLSFFQIIVSEEISGRS